MDMDMDLQLCAWPDRSAVVMVGFGYDVSSL